MQILENCYIPEEQVSNRIDTRPSRFAFLGVAKRDYYRMWLIIDVYIHVAVIMHDIARLHSYQSSHLIEIVFRKWNTVNGVVVTDWFDREPYGVIPQTNGEQRQSFQNDRVHEQVDRRLAPSVAILRQHSQLRLVEAFYLRHERVLVGVGRV